MSSSFVLFTKLHLPQRNKSIGDFCSACAQLPLPSTLKRVLGRISIDVIVHLFSIKEASKSRKSMWTPYQIGRTIPHTHTHTVFYGRVWDKKWDLLLWCVKDGLGDTWVSYRSNYIWLPAGTQPYLSTYLQAQPSQIPAVYCSSEPQYLVFSSSS